ncbi:Predicted PurR-regulated permease PerM [Alkalispirochaeta americana]|uniref:Predicted PurR-regulated permease PerM n=1 Tax=Alkalispirochaeta americana TaxID=159291 RepID=A0A1N6NYT2_9SPIO|nr:AI-2E family transporter [Alkalispirochaeta americana]SIP97254.1 Predicted PurR-regulated permease PerM [Alkalispirochaeta americana]
MSTSSERKDQEESPRQGSPLPPPGQQFRMPLALLRANTAYLFVIALVAVGAVLRLTGGIFIPFVIALLLSFVFAPVVSTLVKYRVPRFLAITAVLALFLFLGYLVVLVLYSTVHSLLREFPKYQMRFTALLREAIEQYNLPADIVSQLEITRTVGNAIISFSGNFMAFISGFMVVIIFLLFLLVEKPYVRKKMELALGNETRRRLNRVLAHINSQIARYLAIKILVSSITAVIVYVLFTIIKVDFPLIWAIMTFLFNFIPSIGSVAITFITGVFAVIQFFPDWSPILATIIGMSITQFTIGNVVDPKMLGDRLNLSPVVILLSLLLWGWLWGPAGLFLAVPLTVVIKIVLEHIPGLEPFGILMGTGNFAPRRVRQGRKRPGTSPP